MNTELDTFSGLKIEVDNYEDATMSGGEEAFIIFLKLYNQTPHTKKIILQKTTYVTRFREQLEQDIWLSGYFIYEGSLKPNSYQKAGLVFYKSKLKRISSEDLLYVSIEFPEEGEQFILCFQNNIRGWTLINKERTEIEVKLSPKQLETNLLKKIERLDAFEEKFGVHFESISVKITNETWITILCELHTTNGTSINDTLKVECILYDSAGSIIDKDTTPIFKDNFYGFQIIEIHFWEDFIANKVNKIRLYPQK